MLHGGFGRILREGMAIFGDASVVRRKKGNRKFTGLRWKEILLGFQFTPKGYRHGSVVGRHGRA
jgi:hypothetical protein